VFVWCVVGTDSNKRRYFSHGFSDKALREQQVILLKHFNIWIEKLGQQHSEPVNMMKWYQLATFDIIGDLTFGEGFGCLESSELHVSHFLEYIPSPWRKVNTVDMILGLDYECLLHCEGTLCSGTRAQTVQT